MPTTSSVCRSPALPRALLRPRKGGYCPSCGELQPFSDSEPALGETCQKTPPPWEHIRFYGAYSGAQKTLLLRGKFGADPAVLHLLGRFLALSCKDLPKPDAIVPVPLHSTRLRERGFNQCQELAHPLSDALGVPLVPDLLLRQHPTRHQVGLSEAGTSPTSRARSFPSRKSGASALACRRHLHDRHNLAPRRPRPARSTCRGRARGCGRRRQNAARKARFPVQLELPTRVTPQKQLRIPTAEAFHVRTYPDDPRTGHTFGLSGPCRFRTGPSRQPHR
ncbi:MAG: ComF family protein [Bilophila wadsworthia]